VGCKGSGPGQLCVSHYVPLHGHRCGVGFGWKVKVRGGKVGRGDPDGAPWNLSGEGNMSGRRKEGRLEIRAFPFPFARDNSLPPLLIPIYLYVPQLLMSPCLILQCFQYAL